MVRSYSLATSLYSNVSLHRGMSYWTKTQGHIRGLRDNRNNAILACVTFAHITDMFNT